MPRIWPRSCPRYVLLDICASLSEQTLAHTMLALHDSKELIQCLGKSRPTFAACGTAPKCATGTLQTSTSTLPRLLWLMAAGQQIKIRASPSASFRKSLSLCGFCRWRGSPSSQDLRACGLSRARQQDPTVNALGAGLLKSARQQRQVR